MVGQIQVAGVPWYRREDWPQIKAIMADADKLHATYDQWLQGATQVVNQIRAKGITAEQVIIDPKTFPDWCRARGLNVDGKARSDFASETAAFKHR